MIIKRLTISNFRGIANATLHFDGHTLLIGTNNVGKSTVCEAIDIVLGPDRLGKYPPIEEFDFYNATYLEEDKTTPRPLRVEIILTDLSAEIQNTCNSHLEFWHKEERRILGNGEVDFVDGPGIEPCLRLEAVGKYDPEEDEFEAQTFFSHSPNEEPGKIKPVSKLVKRMIGFLYLRALRTGSRALSLERGSLLDAILRLGKIKTGLWEQSISRLRDLDPPIDKDATKLRLVLASIEKRLAEYISLPRGNSSTRLFISQLTREHLRKTLAFFLSTAVDQKPVPFQEAGTGTLNTLVLALLSFIAEFKKDNVIFAMEEPEIALPPHTQRRIASYLLTKTAQCFVTSHSPFVIEKFDPSQIQLLSRSAQAELVGAPVILSGALKPKTYRRHARRGLCEAMLGKGVVVAEGLTEQTAIWAVAEKMESSDENNYPLDISGVTIFSSDGDGLLSEFGTFYKNLGLTTFAFYDHKPRSAEEMQKLQAVFDINNDTGFSATEALLVAEVPVDRQWQLLDQIRATGDQGHAGIPAERPNDDEVKALCLRVLKRRKGDGTAGNLIALCDVAELPTSIVQFLAQIYLRFPKPEPTPLPAELVDPIAEAPQPDLAQPAQVL